MHGIRSNPRLRFPPPRVGGLKVQKFDTSGKLIQKTNVFGPIHADTVPFDDSEFLLRKISERELKNLRIATLHVWSGQFVNGIQIEYKIQRMNKEASTIVGEMHFGSYSEPHESVVEFEANENIIGIEGRIGSYMDHLTIHTNLRSLSFGESTGGRSFKIVLPFYCRVIGFIGGTGGHMHNLGLVFFQINRWSPEYNHHFPKDLQKIAKTLMLLALVNEKGQPLHSEALFWTLPKDILYYIIQLAAVDQFNKANPIHSEPSASRLA